MAKISVIVTTYNRSDFLRKTIDSILNQTFQDFELIVVDNFSNYDFFALTESFKSNKIIPIQNQNNGIIAVNRNVGISKAKGEYIAFCDDDDVWIPEKLEKQMQFISNNQLEHNKIVLFTNCTFVSDKSKVISKKKEINSINDFISRTKLITYSTALVSNVRLKFNFNELPEFIAVEDYIFWCNLKLDNYDFFLLQENLVEYRVTPNSESMIHYGLNHLRTIIAQMYIAINYPDAKINNFIFCFSVMKHALKFLIKRVLVLRHS